MDRSWDIMRNSANGADPAGGTSHYYETRQRNHEHVTSEDRKLGLLEQSIDLTMGNDWERHDTIRDRKPSLWARVKAFFRTRHLHAG